MCHLRLYPVLTSSLIFYCTDPRQIGISLFYMVKKSNAGNDDVIYDISSNKSEPIKLCV